MNTVRVEVRQGSTSWTEDVNNLDEFFAAIEPNPYNAEKNIFDAWAVVYGDDGDECDTEYLGGAEYWLEDGEYMSANELNEENCSEIFDDVRAYLVTD